MSDAPKEIGLVSNGLGGRRLWDRREDADNGSPDTVRYIRADLHEALQAEVQALKESRAGVYVALDICEAKRQGLQAELARVSSATSRLIAEVEELCDLCDEPECRRCVAIHAAIAAAKANQ
jgi:hypothetical protein